MHPFRYRSGCDLECTELEAHVDGEQVAVSPAELAGIDVNRGLNEATGAVADRDGSPVVGVTDIYWPPDELFRVGQEAEAGPADAEKPEDEE